MTKLKTHTIFTVSPLNNNPNQTRSSEDNSTNLLYVHFLFQYYLLLSPFRLKKVEKGFAIHSWLPQKIICGTIVLIVWLNYLSGLIQTIYKIKRNNPLSFLKLFSSISRLLFRITLCSGFWFKQGKYLKLVNFLSSSQYKDLLRYATKTESLQFSVLVNSIYILKAFLCWSLGIWILHIWDWSPTLYYRRHAALARSLFFLANTAGNKTWAPELSSFTFGDDFITVICIISRLFVLFMARLTHVSLLVHVLTLWAPVSAFASTLYEKLEVNQDKSEESEFDLFFRQFNALKNLAILIRVTVGDTILSFLGMVVFDYSIEFDAILLDPDLLGRAMSLFNFVSVTCILIISAEIVRKINWFKIWLFEQTKETGSNENKLSILFEAISENVVGINAAGMFTITYSLLGTVGGLLMAYFMIRLQYEI